MRYSNKRKQEVPAKLLPPHNRSVSQAAGEEGSPEATLKISREQPRRRGERYSDTGSDAEGRTARDKFAAGQDTTGLNQSARAAASEAFIRNNSDAGALPIKRRTTGPVSADSNR